MKHIIVAYRPLTDKELGKASSFPNQSKTADIFEYVIDVNPDYRLHYISYDSEKGLDHTLQEFETHSTNVFQYIISLTRQINEPDQQVLVLLHVGKNNYPSFDGKDIKMIENARIGTFMSLHGPVYKNIVHSNGFFIFSEALRPKVELLNEIWEYYDYDRNEKDMYN
jgi:hypothetical protein